MPKLPVVHVGTYKNGEYDNLEFEHAPFAGKLNQMNLKPYALPVNSEDNGRYPSH